VLTQLLNQALVRCETCAQELAYNEYLAHLDSHQSCEKCGCFLNTQEGQSDSHDCMSSLLISNKDLKAKYDKLLIHKNQKLDYVDDYIVSHNLVEQAEMQKIIKEKEIIIKNKLKSKNADAISKIETDLNKTISNLNHSLESSKTEAAELHKEIKKLKEKCQNLKRENAKLSEQIQSFDKSDNKNPNNADHITDSKNDSKNNKNKIELKTDTKPARK